MSVSANIRMELTATETLASSPGVSSSTTVTQNAFNTTVSLNSGTTPPVTKSSFYSITLSAGAGTIDLTSLTGLNGASVTLSGLKIQAIMFINVNATAMTVTKGASNGIGFGSGGATFTIPIVPKVGTTEGKVLLQMPAGTPAVSGSVKTIDVTGGTTDVLYFAIIAG